MVRRKLATGSSRKTAMGRKRKRTAGCMSVIRPETGNGRGGEVRVERASGIRIKANAKS